MAAYLQVVTGGMQRPEGDLPWLGRSDHDHEAWAVDADADMQVGPMGRANAGGAVRGARRYAGLGTSALSSGLLQSDVSLSTLMAGCGLPHALSIRAADRPLP